jgi:hypothetical protein
MLSVNLATVEKIGDVEIRSALLRTLARDLKGQAMILEELGLCQGGVRVDVAVVGELLDGYEIKSERDSLDRLEAQARTYNRVMDRVTLVTCARHLAQAEDRIPKWWGLCLASRVPSGILLQMIRSADQNPHLDPAAFVQLLWRADALRILAMHGGDRGFRSSPRTTIWDELVRRLAPSVLRKIVLDFLFSRLRSAQATGELPAEIGDMMVRTNSDPLLQIARPVLTGCAG